MIDSYFIGLLISTYREAKELGGNLVCVGVNGQVAHAFEVIRLDKVVEVYATLEDALEKMHTATQPDTHSSAFDEINPDDF